MITRSAQSTYEKAVAAALVVLLAIVGWGAFVFTATSLAFVEAALLPMTLAMAVFALGLLYEAAERLLGRGRGIYTAAVFCTLPATGMVAASPGALPAAGLMLINAVAVWMAMRASGDERPYYLGMLTALLLFGGYLFGGFAGSFALPFAGLLAARQGVRRMLAAGVAVGGWIIGVVLHYYVRIGLPTLGMIAASDTMSALTLALPLLPWAVFAVFPLFRNFRRLSVDVWRVEGAGVALLIAVLMVFSGASTSAAGAAFAPLLALLGAAFITDDFSRQHIGKRANAAVLAGLLTAGALLALPLLAALNRGGLPPVSIGHAATAAVLAAALLWTVVRNAPRWCFVLLCGAGLLLSRIIDQHDPLSEAAAPEFLPLGIRTVLMLYAAAAVVWIVVYAVFAARVRRRGSTCDTELLFGRDPLRNFTAVNDSRTARITVPECDAIAFAVFGDVTGAESPFYTRRGGFFAFQSLSRSLAALNPAFAISVGDLASGASPFAYRNLTRMLKQLPVPLAVAPGNHDLFRGHTYDAAPFHALFGADNSVFEAGPVKFVILNNAWGSLRDSQFAWLTQELQTDKSFLILFCHKPPFDFRADAFYAMEDRDHALRLHDLCRQQRVSAVISGHIHSLMTAHKDGVAYVITGGGGSRLVSHNDRHHFLHGQATSGELYLRALPLPARDNKPEPLMELRLKPRR